MSQHRFSNWVASQSSALNPSPACGFMAAPLALLQQPTAQMQNWQNQLYQWAFQRAQAVLEPSWLERDVLAAWN